MKMKMLALMLCVSMVVPSFAHAATDNIAEGMVTKATRGVINLVTGIVEFPMQIYKGYDQGFGPIKNEAGSKTVGTIIGFFRGVGHAAGRTGWGALELFGFWTANPEDNEGVGIPFDAEYAWQYGERYSLFKPSLAEGVKPIGRKLVHGVANGLLGIAEVPSQIKIGMDEGNVVKGIGKGIWYWWSREIYGLGDLYGCLVPNAPDNPGVAFNGEWPWSGLTEDMQ